jgi:hypothetical protein
VRIVVILLIMSLFTIQLVTASTPTFQVTNVINTTLKLDNSTNHGSIVVVKQPYVSREKTTSTYDSDILQKFDKLVWKGNDTIELWLNPNYKTTLIKGSSYYFTDIGLFTYQSIYNRSKTGQIVVNPASDLKINVSYILFRYDDNVPYEMTKKTFDTAVVETEKTYPITFAVPATWQPRDYTLKVEIISSNMTQEVTKTMTLQQNKNWSIIRDELSKNVTMKSGEIRNLGKLYLKNNGNIDFDLKVYLSGNASQFIYVPTNLTLIRGVNTPVPFMIQVPIEQKDGKYESTAKIVGTDNTRDITMKFKIIDSVKPSIVNFSIDTTEVYSDTKIKVYTKDNLNVLNCTIDHYIPESETINNLKTKEVIKLKKDNWLFTADINFKQVGIHWFNVCLTDSSGNVACEWRNQTFPRLNLIQNLSTSKMPTTKAGMITSKPIFRIEKQVPDKTRLKLSRFYTDLVNDTTVYDIRLKDDSGNIYSFTTVNSTIDISMQGQYYLEIKGAKVVKYDGIITITPPKYAEAVTDIHIEGQFRDYKPPHDYTLKWYGKDIQCIANDTGNYDTSSSRCIINFAADVDETTAILPTTVNEMQLERNKWDGEISAREKKIKIRNYWISGMAALCVIVLLTLGYYVAIYPNQRIMKR